LHKQNFICLQFPRRGEREERSKDICASRADQNASGEVAEVLQSGDHNFNTQDIDVFD